MPNISKNHPIWTHLRAGRGCIFRVHSKNTLVIWTLDRLVRNLRDLVNIIEDLNNREVGLKVLTVQGAQIDTPPHGRY